MRLVPSWTLTREGRDSYYEKLDREREWTNRYNAAISTKFVKLANKRFPFIYERYRNFEHKAIVDYESFSAFPEDDSDLGQVVIVRLIYVIRSERGNGVALRLLRELTQVAEYTGCCLLAVCSPFTRLGETDMDETVMDVARDFANFSCSISDVIAEDRYGGPQKRMGQRFRQADFFQIDISETIHNKEKCSPENCWIYLPMSSDPDFREAIGHRLLNCE